MNSSLQLSTSQIPNNQFISFHAEGFSSISQDDCSSLENSVMHKQRQGLFAPSLRSLLEHGEQVDIIAAALKPDYVLDLALIFQRDYINLPLQCCIVYLQTVCTQAPLHLKKQLLLSVFLRICQKSNIQAYLRRLVQVGVNIQDKVGLGPEQFVDLVEGQAKSRSIGQALRKKFRIQKGQQTELLDILPKEIAQGKINFASTEDKISIIKQAIARLNDPLKVIRSQNHYLLRTIIQLSEEQNTRVHTCSFQLLLRLLQMKLVYNLNQHLVHHILSVVFQATKKMASGTVQDKLVRLIASDYPQYCLSGLIDILQKSKNKQAKVFACVFLSENIRILEFRNKPIAKRLKALLHDKTNPRISQILKAIVGHIVLDSSKLVEQSMERGQLLLKLQRPDKKAESLEDLHLKLAKHQLTNSCLPQLIAISQEGFEKETFKQVLQMLKTKIFTKKDFLNFWQNSTKTNKVQKIQVLASSLGQAQGNVRQNYLDCLMQQVRSQSLSQSLLQDILIEVKINKIDNHPLINLLSQRLNLPPKIQTIPLEVSNLQKTILVLDQQKESKIILNKNLPLFLVGKSLQILKQMVAKPGLSQLVLQFYFSQLEFSLENFDGIKDFLLTFNKNATLAAFRKQFNRLRDTPTQSKFICKYLQYIFVYVLHQRVSAQQLSLLAEPIILATTIPTTKLFAAKILSDNRNLLGSKYNQIMQLGLINNSKLYNSFLLLQSNRQNLSKSSQNSDKKETINEQLNQNEFSPKRQRQYFVSEHQQTPQQRIQPEQQQLVKPLNSSKQHKKENRSAPSFVQNCCQSNQEGLPFLKKVFSFGAKDQSKTQTARITIKPSKVEYSIQTDKDQSEGIVQRLPFSCLEHSIKLETEKQRVQSILDQQKIALQLNKESKIYQEQLLSGNAVLLEKQLLSELRVRDATGRHQLLLNLVRAVFDPLLLTALNEPAYAKVVHIAIGAFCIEHSTALTDSRVVQDLQLLLDVVLRSRPANLVAAALLSSFSFLLPQDFSRQISRGAKVGVKLVVLCLKKVVGLAHEIQPYRLLSQLHRVFRTHPPQQLRKGQPSLPQLEQLFKGLKEVIDLVKGKWPGQAVKFRKFIEHKGNGSVFLSYLTKGIEH